MIAGCQTYWTSEVSQALEEGVLPDLFQKMLGQVCVCGGGEGVCVCGGGEGVCVCGGGEGACVWKGEGVCVCVEGGEGECVWKGEGVCVCV